MKILKINKIYHGDCFKLIKKIPDKSVDMILEDMPYGITACKFDKSKVSQEQTDFLNWLKTLSYKQAPQYLELIIEMIKKMFKLPVDLTKYWESRKRIIKDNGVIVLTGSQPFTSMLVMSNLKMFKYELIWDKKTGLGFLDSKFRPLKSHENILVFSFGGCSNGSKIPMKYNPQNLIVTNKQNKNTKSNILNSEPNKRDNFGTTHKNYPKSIHIFARVSGLHPTQKPVDLFKYLIKTYTNEGDLVVDGFSGSGTTAEACINTKRNFICIEKELEDFNKSVEQIKKYDKLN